MNKRGVLSFRYTLSIYVNIYILALTRVSHKISKFHGHVSEIFSKFINSENGCIR